MTNLGEGSAGERELCSVMNMPLSPTEKAFFSNSRVNGRHIKVIANGRHIKVIANNRHIKVIANGRHMKVIASGRHIKVIANGRHIKLIANGRHVNVIAKETMKKAQEDVLSLKKDDNFSGGPPVTAASPLSDFFPFYVLNYIFVFLHAHLSSRFRIFFTYGDLYCVRFFRIILLCLISFVKVSQKKKFEHWSIRVHYVNIDSFTAIIF